MSTMLKSPTPESVKEYNEYIDEQLNDLILNELADYKVGDKVLVNGVEGEVTLALNVKGVTQDIMVDGKSVDMVNVQPIVEPTPAPEVAPVVEPEVDPLADLKIQRVKDIISGKLPVQETRGTGLRFHGTTSPELIFDEAFRFGGSELNIYGGGFYTTDAADVVTGYATKGRGKDSAIYRVEEINDLNIYDMEQPINEIDTVEINKLLPDWTEPIKKGESLVKVFDRMRDDSSSEQIPSVEVQEDFTAIQDYLAKTYNGMKHIGGNF